MNHFVQYEVKAGGYNEDGSPRHKVIVNFNDAGYWVQGWYCQRDKWRLVDDMTKDDREEFTYNYLLDRANAFTIVWDKRDTLENVIGDIFAELI